MNQRSVPDPTIQKAADSDRSGVVAHVPQGYDLSLSIRFVPGRGDLSAFVGRQPGLEGTRQRATHVDLPKDLLVKLEQANRKVLDWLAEDASNPQLFIARPVETLVNAGVDLSRSERKALERIHHAANEVNVIPPGAEVVNFSVTVRPENVDQKACDE